MVDNEAVEAKDELTAEVIPAEEEITIKAYAGKSDAPCARCSHANGAVPAEWTVKVGKKTEHLCTGHARYLAAMHGMMTFPADE